MMARARRASPRLIAVLIATVGLSGLQSGALAAERVADDDEARIEEATRLYLGARYEEAERLLVELVAEHPEMSSLRRRLGVCYYYLRRPERALAHLRGYLAGERGISEADREDVERWIREMEGLLEPTVESGAPVPPPPVSLSTRGPPPSPSQILPPVERGFLLIPYAGWQFPVHGPDWIASGKRFGAVIGGHLSRHVSLSGEPAVATWAFGCDGCQPNHHAVQLDASATVLGHISWSGAQLVFGPRLGWSIVMRNNFDERTYMFVNGLQLGAKTGLFIALSRWTALGFLMDLAYTRSYESDSRCFEINGVGELDCNDTANTAFGALSGALLF